MNIKIYTTGGTFDKVYFDAKSEFKIGDPIIPDLFKEANVTFDFEVESILKKDSLDMTEADRDLIYDHIAHSGAGRILLTHGTDTMVATAQRLSDITDKTIVMFGSMEPARMRYSDAMYNLGVASAAVQLLPHGIYVAMNGQIFDPQKVRKNRGAARFELVDS
ncbi:MAG: asparaginase domain-containing protein [Pseudomonadota bacterium]